MKKLRKKADVAGETRADLPASEALSIVKNGTDSIAGGNVRVLQSHGWDGSLVKDAALKEDARMGIVAPKIGGAEAADGSVLEGKQIIDDGPFVLYDVVAIIVSPESGRPVKEAAARDVVADVFAHCKFIAYTEADQPLLDRAGVEPDEGVLPLASANDVSFIESYRELRLKARDPKVRL